MNIFSSDILLSHFVLNTIFMVIFSFAFCYMIKIEMAFLKFYRFNTHTINSLILIILIFIALTMCIIGNYEILTDPQHYIDEVDKIKQIKRSVLI